MSAVHGDNAAGNAGNTELSGQKGGRDTKRRPGVSGRGARPVRGSRAVRRGADRPGRLLRKPKRADGGRARRAVRGSFRLRGAGDIAGQRIGITEHIEKSGISI